MVINNCRFFVSHREKPAHKAAGSPIADSPRRGCASATDVSDLDSDHLA